MTSKKRSEVLSHFRKADPKVYPYVTTVDYKKWLSGAKNEESYFKDLAEGIIAQQLGTASARAIINRFLGLFPNEQPHPERLARMKPETIKKKIGTSLGKANYLVNLAKAVDAGELNLAKIKSFTDEEVYRELTKIKGIGPWTAEMFLIFSLGHEDIYSHGDYGLKRGI